MKHYNLVLWTFVGIIAVSVGVLTYWQYQPSRVLSATQPFKVLSVNDRTIVLLNATYCKHLKAKGIVRVSFVSHTSEFFTPMSDETTATGCHTNLPLPILMPSDIPPGTYYVKFNATYHINPVRTFNLIIKSDEFEVK